MLKLIRPRSTPPEDKVIDQMARSDERAARADAKVKRFARSAPAPKPYNDTPGLDLAPDVGTTPRPVTKGNLAWAFHNLAQAIKPPEPDIGPSAGPKSVTAPEIGERDTSGLFGTPSPDQEAE